MSGTLRERVLATLEAARAEKERRLEAGFRSNCGLGLPYWELRECVGVRGPIGRLRLRNLMVHLTDQGLVRTFVAYGIGASVGTAVERTDLPAAASS